MKNVDENARAISHLFVFPIKKPVTNLSLNDQCHNKLKVNRNDIENKWNLISRYK